MLTSPHALRLSPAATEVNDKKPIKVNGTQQSLVLGVKAGQKLSRRNFSSHVQHCTIEHIDTFKWRGEGCLYLKHHAEDTARDRIRYLYSLPGLLRQFLRSNY